MVSMWLGSLPEIRGMWFGRRLYCSACGGGCQEVLWIKICAALVKEYADEELKLLIGIIRLSYDRRMTVDIELSLLGIRLLQSAEIWTASFSYINQTLTQNIRAMKFFRRSKHDTLQKACLLRGF